MNNNIVVPFHRLETRNGRLVAIRYAKEEHLLKKPPAWSYHAYVVEAMKTAGVDFLEVHYNRAVYACPLERFLRYAVRHNRGHGEQLFLPLRYWNTNEETEKRHESNGLPLFS